MQTAGEITIALAHRAGKVCGVKLASTRPVSAARLLIGKTPEQALETVPLLFSLCGNAQTYAAYLACRAALQIEPDPVTDKAREILVAIETLREHCWRLLLDWPPLIGRQADKASVAFLVKTCSEFKPLLFKDGDAFRLDGLAVNKATKLLPVVSELKQLIDKAVFGGKLSQFLDIASEAQLQQWLDANDSLAASVLKELYRLNWQALGCNDVACLPELDPQTLFDALQNQDLAEFCRTPLWQGSNYESTPLCRQQFHPLIEHMEDRYGNGLIVRFLATLLEVASLLDGMKLSAPAHAKTYARDGIALVQVQAARGLLIHRLDLREGRVYGYRIVAPTEWNFQPVGVVGKSLRYLNAENGDDLRRQAHWLVQAIDPCVQFKLKLAEV